MLMQTMHEIKSTQDQSTPETGNTDGILRMVVVVSQKETSIFRSDEKGSIPEHVHPDDPSGALKRLKQTEGADAASRGAENVAYYKEIAESLTAANEILLMGSSKGASNATGHFQDYLTTHHAGIAKKIVGAITVDRESMTDGELLKDARDFFLHHPGLPK